MQKVTEFNKKLGICNYGPRKEGGRLRRRLKGKNTVFEKNTLKALFILEETWIYNRLQRLYRVLYAPHPASTMVNILYHFHYIVTTPQRKLVHHC